MIVCLRTVDVPPRERGRFLEWIDENREIRQEHGIIFELVLERPDDDTGECIVITAWPSDDVFDAWIATPHRARLTASDVHRIVGFRPITRYNVVAGYVSNNARTKERAR